MKRWPHETANNKILVVGGDDDYADSGSDAYGFYPNQDPDDYIPSILDDAIASPVEDQIVLAKYDQYYNVIKAIQENVINNESYTYFSCTK